MSEKIKLSKPVELGSETFEFIEIREPILGDLQGLNLDSLSEANSLITLISRISNLPLPAVKKLSFSDLQPISTAISAFLPEK